MRSRLLVCFSLVCFCLTAAASTPLPAASTPADAEPARQLDTVEVAGVQPGPGLWKVSNGEHVLWLVGTLSPVPSKVEWRSQELEERLAEAQAMVGSPSVNVTIDGGRFRALLLLPSMIGMRKNPDDATLQEVLPPETYARWSDLKATYLGRSRKVERWRPIFAAQKLHQKAARKVGLSFDSPAAELVREQVKKRRLPVLRATVTVTVEDPRDAVRDFKASSLDDLVCFEQTLQRLESDLDLLVARANAWSTGDLEALRSLHAVDPASACMDAIFRTAPLRERGIDIDQVRADIRTAWLGAAEQALAEHRVSIGLLSIAELMKADGYLAELSKRGYRVVAPDEDEWDEDALARFD